MNDLDIIKTFVTVFNVLILIALPMGLAFHVARVRKFDHLSLRWWFQVMICMGYIFAINCEIPALWSRLRSFYGIHMLLDYTQMVLNTWDRWGHVLFYIWFLIFTYMVSKMHTPKFIKSIG